MQKIIHLAALLLIPMIAAAQLTEDTLTVSGQGHIDTLHDEATVRASVISKEATADAAININATRMNSVLNALQQVGIGSDQLSTGQFSFNPSYRYDGGQQLFDGYEVRNSLKIKLTDVDSIGPIIDLIIEAGASRIQGVTFDVSNSESATRTAIERAHQDAASKAQILANAAGVNLGAAKVIQLSTSHSALSPDNGNLPPTVDLSSTPILPGNDGISASVTVQYSIHQ